MLFRLDPQALVLLIPALIFALSFHEYAHAWMAYRLGDNTAALMGRLTLNPMAHLDPMGSMMILFVGFGWAKPVPVDPRFLGNPRTDMMKVAAAGPLANFILAFWFLYFFYFTINCGFFINHPINSRVDHLIYTNTRKRSAIPT